MTDFFCSLYYASRIMTCTQHWFDQMYKQIAKAYVELLIILDLFGKKIADCMQHLSLLCIHWSTVRDDTCPNSFLILILRLKQEEEVRKWDTVHFTTQVLKTLFELINRVSTDRSSLVCDSFKHSNDTVLLRRHMHLLFISSCLQNV